MKIVKSLIYLLIVVIIGIFVYLKVYKVEETKKLRAVEERNLIRFDLDNISAFTLVRPDSSIVFERGVGRLWNITSPIVSEADREPIFKLFYSLDTSDILINVDDDPEDLSLYDLSKPQYYMAMKYDSGEPDTLFIGSSTPDSTMSYVKFASEKRVLAVSNILTNFMKQPARSFRSRSILNIVEDDITGVEIQRTDMEYENIVLVFNEITWVMEEPWNHPADPKNMEEFCKKMAESRKSTLIEEKTDNLAQYGLDNPAFVMNINLKYGMPNKMLLIGNRLTEKGKTHLWYAKRFDNDLIFTVENSVVESLKRIPIWFIDKQPIKFNRNSVNKIVLETTKEPITFLRDAADNWSVVSPVDKNITIETINGLFSISRFLLIHDLYAYDPTPKDLAATGLDKQKITLSFFSDDKLMTQVFFGDSFITDKQNTYFRTSLSPIIYISGSNVNSSINNALEEVFSN